MATDYIIVVTTVDNTTDAHTITKTLLEEKLAACVQHFEIKSHYRWKGELAVDNEILLHIKTRRSLFDTVKERIASLHPYELPEILSIDISNGSTGYLEWIDQNTRT